MAQKNYTALELYEKSFKSCGWATKEEIEREQKAAHNHIEPERVLLNILLRKIKSEKSVVSVYPMIKNLRQIYGWLNESDMAEKTDVLLSQLEKPYWAEIKKKQDERLQKTSKAFGLSSAEILRREQRGREELGDEWEKELDERNRKKAGIE